MVERRDGLASYQLAVVVDDAFQGVTRVVRGADLLSSTPWQIDLQAALALPRPIYGHLPLLVEPDGTKLSKSKRAVPLDPSQVRQRAYDDPYAFVADAAPGIGPFIDKRGVELGIYALEPTSACGQGRGALSVRRRQASRNRDVKIVRLRQMH